MAERGGFCYRHRANRRTTATAVTTEGAAVSVPALPPVELEPSETECPICFDPPVGNNYLITCDQCSYAVCNECLVRAFSNPWKFVNGECIYYDPTKCPQCRVEGAFYVDEDAAAEVERGMYRFDAGSVGASYASTSHEQGDHSDYEPSEDDEDEDLVHV